MAASECPRSRRRATMRAWARAAGVHSPFPSACGITPAFSQRRRVAGVTPMRRATSVVESCSLTPAPARKGTAGVSPRTRGSRGLRARPARSAGAVSEPPGLMPAFAYYRSEVYSRPSRLSTGTRVRRRLGGEVRVLVGDDGAETLIYRFRDRYQRERRLDVATGLDAPARDGHRHVLAPLEVLVADRGVHGHADLGLPRHVVGPLPVQVAVLRLFGRADVDDHVEVWELEALRHVGVAQRGPHLRVLAHHREHPVHHLAELRGGPELWLGHLEEGSLPAHEVLVHHRLDAFADRLGDLEQGGPVAG